MGVYSNAVTFTNCITDIHYYEGAFRNYVIPKSGVLDQTFFSFSFSEGPSVVGLRKNVFLKVFSFSVFFSGLFDLILQFF